MRTLEPLSSLCPKSEAAVGSSLIKSNVFPQLTFKGKYVKIYVENELKLKNTMCRNSSFDIVMSLNCVAEISIKISMLTS